MLWKQFLKEKPVDTTGFLIKNDCI